MDNRGHLFFLFCFVFYEQSLARFVVFRLPERVLFNKACGFAKVVSGFCFLTRSE